jgi:hypothetical protein
MGRNRSAEPTDDGVYTPPPLRTKPNPADLRTGGVFPAATLNTSRMLYSRSLNRTNKSRERNDEG